MSAIGALLWVDLSDIERGDMMTITGDMPNGAINGVSPLWGCPSSLSAEWHNMRLAPDVKFGLPCHET